MNAENRAKPPIKASVEEDYGERGLRILGRLIARDLVKRSTTIQDESGYCKTYDLPASKDTL